MSWAEDEGIDSYDVSYYYYQQEKEIMKVSGISAYAFLREPSKEKKLDNGIIPSQYSINLILDIKTAKLLKAEGLNVKKVKKEIPGIEGAVGKHFLMIKKAATYKDIPTSPIDVVDSELQPFKGLVGNGSKVNVVFAAKEWEAFGTSGVAAKLRKVQIIDLVEYSPKEDLEEFEKEDGFLAGKSVEDSGIPFGDDLDDVDF